MRDRPDFVQVRLSDAGVVYAGEGATVRVATVHLYYVFTGKAPVEVLLRGEWPVLRAECDANGAPLFELATDAAPGDEVPAAPKGAAAEGKES